MGYGFNDDKSKTPLSLKVNNDANISQLQDASGYINPTFTVDYSQSGYYRVVNKNGTLTNAAYELIEKWFNNGGFGVAFRSNVYVPTEYNMHYSQEEVINGRRTWEFSGEATFLTAFGKPLVVLAYFITITLTESTKQYNYQIFIQNISTAEDNVTGVRAYIAPIKIGDE